MNTERALIWLTTTTPGILVFTALMFSVAIVLEHV